MMHLLGLIEMAAGGLSYNSHEIAYRINRIGAYASALTERPEFKLAVEEALSDIRAELIESAAKIEAIEAILEALPTERATLDADITMLFGEAAE